MTRRAVILFGHGSRDPAWREPMDALASRIRALSPQTSATCAFLELQAPDLPCAIAEAAANWVEHCTVLPMFLGVGKHAREDLPRLVEASRAAHPHLAIQVLPSVGERGDVLDLLARAALQAPP